ncbi:MAG TPA: ATP-binding protein [Tenuifilaceae bacterium]|nr:ATP-binding protein [Tenuifilaceae bacterium]HPE18793.1 ATP-binding protein [Tenuifilaceae bacterium]HPQ34372.1 ATP-binding protein [Tenuifilaceae bacterium]
MVFKSFRIKIIFRILLLAGVLSAFIFFVQKPNYYFTSGELMLVAILLIAELIYFVEKGYRQLNHMLQSVKEKDFSLTFNPVENNSTLSQLSGLLNELTEAYRKVRIEKELHYQFLNHLVNQIRFAIVCFDENGNITLANKAAQSLVSLSTISNISSFRKLNSGLPSLLQSLKPIDDRLITFQVNGEIKKFSVTCTSIKLLEQELRIVAFHDIGEPLKKQELESYRKLIRVLTHEIMNSVTPILSLSEAMTENFMEKKNNTNLANTLTEQEITDIFDGYQAIEVRSRALMRFVNDFRSITKLPTPHFKTVNVLEMLNTILNLFKPNFESNCISVNVCQSAQVNSIEADKDLLEQAIINLLKNAMEATGEASNPEIEICLSESSGIFSISITDNGKGIDLDEQEKVFIPFFSTKREGSGIGLTISQEIARLHNGAIKLKSITGKFTTFSINIPVNQLSS